MQNFIIGKKYTFRNEESKRCFIKAHSTNAKLVERMKGDVFTVVSGRIIYSDIGTITFANDTIVQNAETISVNGNIISNGSSQTAIGNAEMCYFVDYISTEEQMNKEFKSQSFETLVNIYLHYYPNAAESKITMSSLRKCWIHHGETVKKKQVEFEQMKTELEQLISLSK